MTSRKERQDAAGGLNSGAVHLLRALRPVDRRSGLTDARLSALSVLVFGGSQPLGRLARIEGVASPTMSRIVDGLEGLGLVRRVAHPDGGRVVLVEPTPAGRVLMEDARTRRVDVIQRGLDALDASERAALVQAAHALPRLAAVVRELASADAD